LTLCRIFEDIFFLAETQYFGGTLSKNKNNMDVIQEIKQFESHPDRSHFSPLQIADFYKSLVGRTLSFEAIISAVHRGNIADCEIYADTFTYSVQHNPVTERDYLNWVPDMSFICEAGKNDFKLNPLLDLIKGDKIRCTATFIRQENKVLRVKLTALDKLAFMEAEKDKELLEKKFNEAYEERTIYAPQRQSRKNIYDKAVTFSAIGGFIGGCMGLFWGGVLTILGSEDTSLLWPGFVGAMLGALILGSVGIARGGLGSDSRR
jgi:hypothetical protein